MLHNNAPQNTQEKSMFIVYDDAIMPLMSEEELKDMIQSLRDNILKMAKSEYVGLIMNIFQGLYVYLKTGVNISVYREVEEAAKSVKMNYQELMDKSHELAKQLVRRPNSPFKEPETELNVSLTFVPRDKYTLVLVRALNTQLEACIHSALREKGAKRHALDNESYQKYVPEDGATLTVLVDFEKDLADFHVAKELAQVLCASDATLAYLAAEKKIEIEKFGEFIKAQNETGEMNFDKAYALCSDAMDFAKKFLVRHAEEIRALSMSYMPKLDTWKLFNDDGKGE